MMDNYPMLSASEEERAPWNQEEAVSIQVPVCISITLSKTVMVDVSDYKATKERDEEGNSYMDYDFSECDLKAAVREQVTLPNEVEFMDWDEDDFEVVME